MRVLSSTVDRTTTAVGLACLAMTLILLPMGVRIARAGEGDAAIMSVDPELAARTTAEGPEPRPTDAVPVVAPVLPADPDDALAERPGAAGREIRPGVVVLNTRGYNYGPPPARIDPAALGHESGTR
ncbi:MAG TPA: hypothetical protein ENI85_17170 [Deltaproteobacteria bacterium]|nr:hypothetical protein [Deltaproteobacteria bacterium]